MSSSVHIYNKEKDILILGKCLIQGLNDTMLTAETQYLINFRRANIKFCLHHNESSSVLFVNSTKKLST